MHTTHYSTPPNSDNCISSHSFFFKEWILIQKRRDANVYFEDIIPQDWIDWKLNIYLFDILKIFVIYIEHLKSICIHIIYIKLNIHETLAWFNLSELRKTTFRRQAVTRSKPPFCLISTPEGGRPRSPRRRTRPRGRAEPRRRSAAAPASVPAGPSSSGPAPGVVCSSQKQR